MRKVKAKLGKPVTA